MTIIDMGPGHRKSRKYKGVLLRLRDDKPGETTTLQCYLPSCGLKVGNHLTLRSNGRNNPDESEVWVVEGISKEETDIEELDQRWGGEGIDYFHPASAKLDFSK